MANLVVQAVHEVEHGVRVAQPLRGHVQQLDARLPVLVCPAEILIDLLDRSCRGGACQVGGRDASAWSLSKARGKTCVVGVLLLLSSFSVFTSILDWFTPDSPRW